VDRAIASSVSTWFSSQQAAGARGAGILPAVRDGNSQPLAGSSGEGGNLLETCALKHRGAAGGFLSSSSRHHQSLCSHLPDVCILLITRFRCCSSHHLKLEQETAGLVPWLQLGRRHSQLHAPLVLQKTLKFCLVSPARSGKLCWAAAEWCLVPPLLKIWGFEALGQIESPKPSSRHPLPCPATRAGEAVCRDPAEMGSGLGSPLPRCG